jgi:hypothetical protein
MAIHNSMSAVAEHSVVKAVTPFVIAALIGATSWMFSSITTLQNQMILFTEGKLTHIEEKLTAVAEDVDDMYDLITDLRINSRLSPREKDRGH